MDLFVIVHKLQMHHSNVFSLDHRQKLIWYNEAVITDHDTQNPVHTQTHTLH